ncbi:DUF58 domain-containing protein [Edaphobacillus lindanitolerans]|uniref:Uncharacterized conserved protein, DUF58 family, contains vWF domain n=1 Tax=Edaphobacillus lindanitolerans TaxID=550447 RepID=A0A1U7PQH5_9BACI|nr:DUF58 domain-containing protein [Edaphobacillus lindanitolerans]SIT92803.1 Uncharacterized conserved protein, DUF58 family, contains vWF domain [Edaphobacillus lindanitolerans]
MSRLRKAAPVLRLAWLILLLAGTFAYAKFQGGRVSWTVFYMLLPFVLYGILLFFYPLRDIGFRRELERRELPFGGTLKAEVTLARKIPFPLLYVSAAEELHNGGTAKRSAVLLLLGMRRRKTWQYETAPLRRGEHVLEGLTIEASDFFGWMKKKVFLPGRETVLVLPKILDLRQLPVSAADDRGAAASSAAAVRDPASASGIREYEPGDRMSRIHWPSFARTGSLHTKEFEDRRSQDLLLVLDGRSSGTFEEQVSLAASVLKMSAADRSASGFVSLGPSGAAFPRVEGLDGHHEVLRHLARLQPSAEGAIPYEGRGLLAGAATMTIITGKITPGWTDALLADCAGLRSGILLSVLGPGERPDEQALSAAKKASARGLDVRFVTERDFVAVRREEGRAS